jgi:hypothetical protein
MSDKSPVFPGTPEYQHMIRTSPVCAAMVASGVPLTPENHIGTNWPDGFGDDGWTVEHEEQLPSVFQSDYEAE